MKTRMMIAIMGILGVASGALAQDKTAGDASTTTQAPPNKTVKTVLPAKRVTTVTYNHGFADGNHGFAEGNHGTADGNGGLADGSAGVTADGSTSAKLAAPVSKGKLALEARKNVYYPDSELLDTYRKQLDDTYQKEQAERLALAEKSRFETRKKLLQDEITKMRMMIESLRVDTEQAKSDQTSFKTGLVAMERDFQETVASLEKATQQYQVAKDELENVKSALEVTHAELQKKRTELSDMNYKKQEYMAQQTVDIQGLQTEVTQLRTRVDQMRENEQNYDLEVAKNMDAKEQVEHAVVVARGEMQEQHEKLEAAKLRLTESKVAVKKVQNDLEVVQKQKHELDIQVADEIFKLDKEIQATDEQRVAVETKKETFDVSANRLKKYISMIHQIKMENQDEQEDNKVIALQSKVALAGMKAKLQVESTLPLAQDLADIDQAPAVESVPTHMAKVTSESLVEKKRSVASAASEGFVFSKSCPIYNKPSSHVKASRMSSQGESLAAEPYLKSWMVYHGAEGDYYFKRDCGSSK